MIPFARVLKYGNKVQQVVIDDIQSSIDSNCVILSNNTMLARGYNTNYNFGISTNQNKFDDWTYIRDDVAKMFIGALMSIIFTTDGRIMGTGSKKALGIMDGSFYTGYTDITDFLSTRGFTIDNIQEIHIGTWSTLILRTDGNLYGIGDNGWNELGTTGSVTSFRLIANSVQTCYLSTGSSYYVRAGVLYSAGRNSTGQLGRNSSSSSLSSFGAVVGLGSGTITSINETGSGCGVVLENAGTYKAYVAGRGMGTTNVTTFVALSGASSRDGFFSSGCPNNMNLFKTDTILYGTGTGTEFGLDSGTYSTWVNSTFPATTAIKKMVSLRSYGTYILTDDKLYAVQVSADWFGEVKSGWQEQKLPSIT